MCQFRSLRRTILLASILVTGILVIASFQSPAQAWDDPDLTYVTGGTSGDDVGRNIVLDSAGNVYVAAFADTATTFSIADSPTITCTLSPCASRQLILVKLSPAGRVVWIRPFQSNTNTATLLAEGLAIDPSNNLYFAGNFHDDLVFGATTLSSPGAQSGFVVKLTSGGDTVWAHKIADTGIDLGVQELDVDSSGNLLLSGEAKGDVSVGNLTISQGAMGNLDGFLLRFDSSGNPVWGVRVGGTANDSALDTSFDANGDVYLAGYVDGAATISATSLPGGGTRSTATSVGTSLGNSDFYLAKFDSTGVIDTNGWPIRFGGANADQGISMTSEASTIAIATASTGDVTIGATTFAAGAMTSTDVFVASFTTSGTLTWGSRITELDEGADSPRAVELAPDGDVITTGQYGTSKSWFVSRHAADTGTLSWIDYVGAGQGSRDIGQSLSFDADGFIYATGRFDGGQVDPHDALVVAPSRGSADVLVVRLNPTGGLAPHPPIPDPVAPSPVTPIWRASLDPNGGTCLDTGTERDAPWTSVFVGYRYLPSAVDCTREGHVFTGWASTDDPTTLVELPRLTDPSDGERRMFLAANADLVATWTPIPDEITDLTVFANFLCGPCTNTWLLFTMPTDATNYSVSVNDTPTECAQSGEFFDLSVCEITDLTPGPITFAVTPHNVDIDGPAATKVLALNG